MSARFGSVRRRAESCFDRAQHRDKTLAACQIGLDALERPTSTTVLLIRMSLAQAGIPPLTRELQAQLRSDVTMSTTEQSRYTRIRVDDAQG